MSFISVSPDSHFPIQNLPYGVFSTKSDVSLIKNILKFNHAYCFASPSMIHLLKNKVYNLYTLELVIFVLFIVILLQCIKSLFPCSFTDYTSHWRGNWRQCAGFESYKTPV